MRLILIAALLLTPCIPASAQCGPAGCSIGSRRPAVASRRSERVRVPVLKRLFGR